jgi:hypothetical protein
MMQASALGYEMHPYGGPFLGDRSKHFAAHNLHFLSHKKRRLS